MPSHGWPDHSGRPEDYDRVDDDHDTTRCEGISHVAGRLVFCASTDDLVDGLCVACTAEQREREEKFWADNPDLLPFKDSGLQGNGAGQYASTHAQVRTSQNAMPGKGENPGPISPADGKKAS